MKAKALFSSSRLNFLRNFSRTQKGALGLMIVVAVFAVYSQALASQYGTTLTNRNSSPAGTGSRAGNFTNNVTPATQPALLTTSSNTARAANAPAGCTTTWIPYQTTYQTSAYLPKGQTSTVPGVQGLRITCPNHPTWNYSSAPVNAIVSTGTYVAPASVTPTVSQNSYDLSTQTTYDNYIRGLIQQCKTMLASKGAGGSSAYDQCNYVR